MLAIAFGFIIAGIKGASQFLSSVSFISNLWDISLMALDLSQLTVAFGDLSATIFNVDVVFRLAGFLILLFTGYVVGKIGSHVAHRALMHLKINDYIHAGEHFKFEVAHISSLFVKWILYLVFVRSAVGVLDIFALSEFFGTLVSFLIDLMGAGAAILVSFGIGVYAKDHVIGDNTHHADIVGKMIMYIFLFLGVSIGLEVALPGKAALVTNILTILVASIGLGLAIALGFGLRDVIGKMAEDYAHDYKEKSKKHKSKKK